MLNIKKDFPWFDKNPNTIYCDTAATSLKPKMVVDGICEYITNQSTNPHNIDSNFAFKAHKMMDDCRVEVSQLINCKPNEIIFTSGATEALNLIANGLSDLIHAGDEIVLTHYEHASNLLPWFKIKEDKKAIIKYATSDIFGLTANDFVKQLTNKTKVVSFIGTSNLLGNNLPVEEIIKAIRSFNPKIYICVDVAQMIPHVKCDVTKWDVDFIAFSGHKIFSDSGVGVAFIKHIHQQLIRPIRFGGGMNTILKTDGFVYSKDNEKFEGGTPNISGIYSLYYAIKYFNQIGYENIHKHEMEIYELLHSELKNLDHIEVYNWEAKSAILTFNVKNTFSQDVANYFGKKDIIVRSGLSCAKILNNVICTDSVVRASFYVYTTKEDIMKFIEVLKSATRENILNELI
ncbi:MAG: aminotransferase class V-fold PLP-dependent enzyme [Mycoplasma sp.]